MQTHRQNKHGFIAGAFRVGLVLAVGSVGLNAQVEPLSDAQGEFSAFTGVAFGGTGSHALVGGSTGVYANRYAALLIGSTFLPLGANTLVPYTRVTSRSHLYDSSFTLNVQIPVNRRWAPYGLLSTDVLYNTYQIEATRPLGGTYLVGQGDVKFAVGTGGGVRYYVAEEWGVKGEYRYTISTQNFSQFAFGVFYRLPSSWPFLLRARPKCGRACTD